MLAGLVVLLLLSSVEALPAKKTQPAHKPVPTKKTSCPMRAPPSKLHKRTPVAHPSAKKAVTLFHGTETLAAATSMAKHVDLSKTHTCGDLHHNQKHGSDGGAYFTDSIIAAAQFSCYKDAYDPSLKLPATVYVLEFAWTPGSHKVYEFAAKDKYTLSEAQCGTHDMVTGPMWNPITDKSFTKNFWQYAVVKQAATTGLAYRHTYTVHCKNVPKGEALTGELYTEGQGGNPKFSELATQLTC